MKSCLCLSVCASTLNKHHNEKNNTLLRGLNPCKRMNFTANFIHNIWKKNSKFKDISIILNAFPTYSNIKGLFFCCVAVCFVNRCRGGWSLGLHTVSTLTVHKNWFPQRARYLSDGLLREHTFHAHISVRAALSRPPIWIKQHFNPIWSQFSPLSYVSRPLARKSDQTTPTPSWWSREEVQSVRLSIKNAWGRRLYSFILKLQRNAADLLSVFSMSHVSTAPLNWASQFQTDFPLSWLILQ